MSLRRALPLAAALTFGTGLLVHQGRRQPPAPIPAPAPPDTAKKEESPALKLATSLVSQIAIYAALLYYFGWVRTDTLLGAFGLSPDVVGLSAQDYMMRAVRPFVPVAIGIASLLLLAAVVNRHVLVPGLAATGRRRRVVVRCCAVTRILCSTLLACAAATIFGSWLFTDLGSTLLGARGEGILHLLQPLAVAVGAGGLLFLDRAHGTARRAARPQGNVPVRPIALYGLLVLAMFWVVGLYAVHDGQTAAARPETLRGQPSVTVNAVDRLGIGGTETPNLMPDAKYKWRYSGFRLLIGTSEKYFLIPDNPQPGAAAITAVDGKDDAVRVDFLG